MSASAKNKRLLLFTLCAILFMLGFEYGGFQLALLQSTNELGLGGARMGFPVAAQFISSSFLPLIFGPVSDRVGKKLIIAVFMAVMVTGSFITWLSGSATEFLVGIFIIGVGYGVCDCTVTASISDAFPGDEEKYINLVHSFLCAGAILSPIVLQTLIDYFSASWRMIFLICAIATAAILPALLLTRMSRGSAGTAIKSDRIATKNAPLPIPVLSGFLICIFVYVGIESGLAFFADTALTIGLGVPVFGAYAISLYWAAMGIGRFYFGRIKKIPENLSQVSLFCLAAVITGIMFSRQEVVMLVLFAAAGFACSSVWPGIVNAAIGLNRSASGKIMSYLVLGGGIGGALLPLFMGIIIDSRGIPAGFLVLAACSVFTGFYMWRITKAARIIS